MPPGMDNKWLRSRTGIYFLQFEKVELAPGEAKTVEFVLDNRAFAYWSNELHGWHVESGEYEIQIGVNAQDIVLAETVSVESETVIKKEYTLNSTLGEILSDSKGKAVFEHAMAGMAGGEAAAMGDSMQSGNGSEAISSEMMMAMMEAMPLRQLISFIPGVTKEALKPLLTALNR